MKDDSVFHPIEDYIKNFRSRPTTSFYPSSASCIIANEVVGECLRKQYYRWKQVPGGEESSWRSWLSQRLGSAYEKAFLEGYRAQGLLKAADYPFRVTIMGLPISGRLDGLTKKGEIIECKSVYGKAFYMKLGNSVMNRPKPEHLCQIMVYLAVLGLDTCILPYGSRDDTGRRQGYRIRKRDIEREGILFIKIIQRWKILQLCLTTNMLPERDYDYEDWQCRYCQFRKLCYRSPKDLETNLL
jgi:hypothetical protein